MARSVRYSRLAPVAAVPRFAARVAGQTIGILGGSFNPPHAGHLHISVEAYRRLGLDAVWWLVSPGNPLKDPAGYPPLAVRVANAKAITASCPWIRVLDIEQHLQTSFTVQTLRFLRNRNPQTRMIWLMGADCIVTMPRWRHWPQLWRENPIAIFARTGYTEHIVNMVALQRFRQFRHPLKEASILTRRKPPAWVMMAVKTHPASSTMLRQEAL